MAGSPSSTAPSLAVVPPMSKVMTCLWPSSPPTIAAISTPAAGPDSTMRTGNSRAKSGDTRPPFDCMMKRSWRKPRSRNAPSQPADVAVDDRPHIGVGDSGAGALVFAELGRDVADSETNSSGDGPGCGADGALVLRVGVGVQQAKLRPTRSRPPVRRRSRRPGCPGRAAHDRAVMREALGDLEDVRGAAPAARGLSRCRS